MRYRRQEFNCQKNNIAGKCDDAYACAKSSQSRLRDEGNVADVEKSGRREFGGQNGRRPMGFRDNMAAGGFNQYLLRPQKG